MNSFVENLKNKVLSWPHEDSFCVSLEGPWGSGKSSIVNLLLNEIKQENNLFFNEATLEDNEIIIMEFKPWIFSGKKELIQIFLNELKIELKKKNKLSNLDISDISDAISEYAKEIALISALAGPAATAISLLLLRLISGFRKKSLADLKEHINKALIKKKYKILITIDDMDRMSGLEIKEIFQLVKAVADFPNTIYLLSYDAHVVNSIFKKLKAGEVSECVEKIIQVRVDVPNIVKRKVIDWFFNEINKIDTLGNEIKEDNRLSDVRGEMLPIFIKNIRGAKRILNRIIFKYSEIKDEVNSLDMVILEIFKNFVPDIYDEIKKDRFFILYVEDSQVNYIDTKRATTPESRRLLEKIPKEIRSDMAKFISLLFPGFASSLDGEESFIASKRTPDPKGVYNKASWRKYFQWEAGYLESEVPANEAEDFFNEIDESLAFFSRLHGYFKQDRIINLLEGLEDKFNHLNVKKTTYLIKGLFKYGDRDTTDMSEYFYLSKQDWIIKGYIYRLLEGMPDSERTEILVELIEGSRHGLILPYNITKLMRSEHNNNTGISTGKPLVAKDRLNEIIKAFISILYNSRDLGELSKKRELAVIVIFWKKLEKDKNDVLDWVNSNILDDNSLITNFLAGFLNYETADEFAEGNRRDRLNFNYSVISSCCDIKKLEEKCRYLEGNSKKLNLSKFEIELIKDFFRAISSHSTSQ